MGWRFHARAPPEGEGEEWDEKAAWDLWEAGKGPNPLAMMAPEERERCTRMSARASANV